MSSPSRCHQAGRRTTIRKALARLRASPEHHGLTPAQAAERLDTGEERVRLIEQDPTFWRTVHDLVLRAAGRHLLPAYEGLCARAANGDVSAVKLYLSQSGFLASEAPAPAPDRAEEARWRAARNGIIAALNEHPAAREAVLRHLEAIER